MRIPRPPTSTHKFINLTEFLKNYVDSHLDRGDRVPVFLGPQLSEEFHELGSDEFIEAINVIRSGNTTIRPDAGSSATSRVSTATTTTSKSSTSRWSPTEVSFGHRP